MREPMWLDDVSAPSTSNSHPRSHRAPSSRPISRFRTDNVFRLVARREVVPHAKRLRRRFWVENSEGHPESVGLIREAATDARHGLMSWVEAESLQHLSARYCPLFPPPRSTIAAAFSPDGKTLASTHGDHTVKIIDCYTGNCLKVLSGHRRTPWVVRFHPMCPEILASGSLDHEVRLWDATTAECIASKDFYRPIASIAFHAQGEILAVASGHKLFIWNYSRRGETTEPAMVLKTRRSLRAVLFHPHAAPFLLTAEVNDLDSSDSVMTVATSQGYLCYPPPTLYVTNAHSADRSSSRGEPPFMSLPLLIWPPVSRDDGLMSFQHRDESMGSISGLQRLGGGASVRLLTYPIPLGGFELLLSPVEADNSSSVPEERRSGYLPGEMDTTTFESAIDAMDTTDAQPDERHHQFLPFGDPACLHFFQGFLAGQSQSERHMMRPRSTNLHENSPMQAEMPNHDSLLSPAIPIGASHHRLSLAQPSRPRVVATNLPVDRTALHGPPQEENDPHRGSRVQPDLATSLAAAAAAELPCTVKLRIWPHDIKDPFASLAVENCRLTIPHAVLCSEMGTHFSPCGRFLAACVACVLPHVEGDPGLAHSHHHDTGASTSPTRHPLSAHQVIYELRIYSLEEATFGAVLASRAVRAAHCLTSIQFSPTSEHLLLAYGRRHGSLLESVVADGEATIHVYTILEVYRVSDMELVRVLPDAEDEVNVACFHPSVGEGLVYGTKEGKLRIFHYDSSNNFDCLTSGVPHENTIQVPPYAFEG
ncbi:hypothetical protein Dimus_001723 [Dionaea muscipula]